MPILNFMNFNRSFEILRVSKLALVFNEIWELDLCEYRRYS